MANELNHLLGFYLSVILVVSIMGQEELFTCEFLLLKLNMVDCMTDSTELGYDLSEKISTQDGEITALNSKLGMDVNDLEGKITALDTKLVAEIDSDITTATSALETKITDLDTTLMAEIDSDITTATTALETKITALETMLNGLSAIFNVRYWVTLS